MVPKDSFHSQLWNRFISSCKDFVKKQAKNQEECDQRNNIIPFCVSIKIFIGLLKKDKVLLHVLHLKVCSRRENLPNLIYIHFLKLYAVEVYLDKSLMQEDHSVSKGSSRICPLM